MVWSYSFLVQRPRKELHALETVVGAFIELWIALEHAILMLLIALIRYGIEMIAIYLYASFKFSNRSREA